MKDVIRHVLEYDKQFREGAKVVSEGSTTLSDGAQTQSANVEEMSAAIENLNTMIRGVADNAKSANEVADETASKAQEGGEAVEKSIEAMKLINKSAEQIINELTALKLPNLWMPNKESFYQIDEIPVLGTGKLDLQAIKQLAKERVLGANPTGAA